MTATPTPRELGFRMPAEWERHEATWLTWPKDPLTWPDRVPQAEAAYAELIEALSPGEKVHLLVDDEASERRVRSLLAGRKIEFDKLRLHRIPTSDSWIRDYGPIFLNATASADQLMLDWVFNAWGNKYETLKADDTVPEKIALLLKLPLVQPGIVLEGGSIEVNGEGALLTTEQCLLNPNRNPGLDKKDIEAYLRDYLGVAQILWLGEGIEGDDTDGHVDDITRFVSPDTVVTAVEEDPSEINFHPLRENLKRLRAMRLADGRSLRVVELPMPGPVFSDEGRLPASYANFYIGNAAVVVPVFGHANDGKALAILQELFPHRRVRGIRAEDLVWGMGAFHCLTQQQPAGYNPREA